MDQYVKLARKFNKGVESLIGNPQQFRQMTAFFIALGTIIGTYKYSAKLMKEKIEQVTKDDLEELEKRRKVHIKPIT